MALHVPKAPGFAQMLKEGAKHYSGLEEAVYRNISACKELADTVRTAYGPNGLNKIIVNHIDKLFVTNDAATIIRELEVEHPAAKMIVFASKIQEEEIGDGTNFVLILCGALLDQAENLLRMGLTPVEIGIGYEKALKKVLEILPGLSCYEVKDTHDLESVTKVIRSSIMSKQYGQEDFLAHLIAKACVSIMPEKTAFNVDNIRVCKILGMGVNNSEVIQGMVFKKHVEGDIAKKMAAKIVVYTCPVDIGSTETKGTVLIKTAEELVNFSDGEESLLEKQINALKEAGVDVVVAGGKIGDMAIHFINKAGLMAVRLQSKFDIRRLCKTVSATPLPNFTTPLKEELGYVDCVYTDEIGDQSIVVFRLDGKESRVATIVLRGSTDNSLDDIERAIDDGVNTFKTMTKDARAVAGAGAIEVELAKEIRRYAESLPGLQQYPVLRFADSLEVLPKTIADNSGLNGTNIVCSLRGAHEAGKSHAGLNIEGSGDEAVLNAHEVGIWDLYLTKMWALKYATETASLVLRIDQIIMAKKAGGPAPKAPRPGDEDD